MNSKILSLFNLALLICASAALSFGANPSFVSNYQYERTIVIDHTKVANTDQTDFPVLISGTLPDLATVANGGNVQNANGYDIIFTADADGQVKLDHEIDTYNPVNGAIGFWVRIPTLSHTTDTTIYMWYGNATVTSSQENKAGVWRNGYAAVYHLGNGSTVSASDSSGQNSGTVSGVNGAPGVIGGGGSFAGNSSSYIKLPNSSSLKPTSALTLEAWVNPTSATGWNKIFALDYNANGSWATPTLAYTLSTFQTTGQPAFQIATNFQWTNLAGSTVLPTSAWTHLVGTYDGNIMHLYINGVADPATVTTSGPIDYGTSKEVVIGKDSLYASEVEPWNGKLDELRISSIARSADWIATEYNNQSSPGSFAFISSPQLAGTQAGPSGTPWIASSYSYVRPITIDHTKIPNTDQTDFPVLISGTFPSLASAANGGHVQNPNGYDIIFTSDADGQSKLDHEIDTYNSSTGAISFWVRVPALSHTNDTTIYMWYGNSGVIASEENKTGVWRNGYAAVYHLGNGTTINGNDSTTRNNGVVVGASGSAGAIGGGGTFSGTGGQYIELLNSPSLKPTSALTLEAWVNPTAVSGGYNKIFAVDYRANGTWTYPYLSYALSTTNSTAQPGMQVTVNGTDNYFTPPTALPLNTWTHLVGTYDGSAIRMYLDGVQSGNGMPVTGNIDYGTSQEVMIGRDSVHTGSVLEAWNGGLDELRISNVARTADWVAAEYNNQSSPQSFAFVCPEQAAGSGPNSCETPWITSSYAYEQAITINHTKVPNTDQTDFPVLISGTFPNLATVANGGNVQNANGYDIIFTSDAEGQIRLDHEIDTYNPTSGAINFWVRVSTLSHTNDTTIYMWYGNSTVTSSEENKSGVWRNGYAAVYHLGNGSSVNGNDSAGINKGTVNTVTAVSGPIGGGGSFSGSSSSYIQLPNSLSVKPPSALTLEAWVNPTSVSGGYNKIFALDYRANGSWTSPYLSYALSTTNSTAQPGMQVTVGGNASYLAPSTTLPLSTWTHMVGTYDGSAIRMYQNGTQSGSMALSGNIDYGTSQEVVIGKDTIHTSSAVEAWNGKLDELRISNVARSADWISTEYNNQSSPATFQSMGGNNSVSGLICNSGSPSFNAMSPTIGAIGSLVTITGNNLGFAQNASQVLFGTITAAPIAWSNNSVTVQVPVGSVSSAVTLQVCGNELQAGNFSVAPSVSSVNPPSAPIGDSVVINGSGFGSSPGSIAFNGVTAVPSSWTNTQIIVPVPVGATTGNVAVTVNGSTSPGFAFTVLSAPVIATLSATSGPVGVPVTISGTNFGSVQGSSTLTFGGVVASATNWSSTSITATVPAGATTGNAVVIVNGVASNGVGFTVLSRPGIVNISPSAAAVGMSVTIAGTGFGSTQGSSTVTFNGVAGTPTSWSEMNIVVPVPTGATTGNVVVTINGVASNSVRIVISGSSQVAQVQPADTTTNVPLNDRVIVRFAQPLQASQVVPGFINLLQAGTSVQGTLALSNDNLSVTFSPSQNLTASTTYNVTVDDAQGNVEFQSTFSTGSSNDTLSPRVVQTNPQSNQTGVAINAPIKAEFSKSMDPSTLTPQTFQVTDTTTGQAIGGMVQVDPAGLNAAFVPQSVLAVNRTYRINLSSSVTDNAGNALSASQASFSFTTSFNTDTQGPSLLSVSPPNGAGSIPLNAQIVVEFSAPLDPTSITNGFQVQANGAPVAGGIALSDGNKRITFTPQSALSPSTTYVVVATDQITDIGGLPLQDPSTFEFTTGTSSDTTTPHVVTVNPFGSAVGVPTNVVLELQFSKPINPITVTGATWNLFADGGQVPVPGTISVSSDGLSATFTPSAALDPETNYLVVATTGVTDIEGQPLTYEQSSFTTGSTSAIQSPTITAITPQNGFSNVPINTRVEVVLSAPINIQTMGTTSIRVQGSGGFVSGTTTLSGDGQTLTFTPTNLLATSTTYTVNIGGFADQAGNLVTPFTSTFSTTSSAVQNTTHPSVVSISPVSGASAVAVNSSIVLTFNEPVDSTTINDGTVQIWQNGSNGVLAGSYAVDATGTVLTFTPGSQLPGNVTINVEVINGGVLDLSGNSGTSFFSSFTTAGVADTTPPSVISVTPQNGTIGVGLNSTVVLTFSKSLNASTITNQNFGLMINGSLVDYALSRSADNRVVTLNPFNLPTSSTVTVVATSGVMDLSGNALTNFQSQFTTAPAFDTTHPSVVTQHPGNGARNVPLNTNVVLYLSEPMDAASVQGAFHVSQNGALVSGTAQVSDNGQVVQFNPSTVWQPNALIQVSLDSTATDVNGNSATAYQGTFTAQPDSSTVVPTLLSSNPSSGAGSGVPTNIVMAVEFNEPIDPNSLNADTVQCSQNGGWLQTASTLIANGTVLEITPRFPLFANTGATCQIGTLQGVNGLSFNGTSLSFTTGTGPDTTIPTITSISPSNGSSNVGDNALIRLVFSKPIDPLTVNTSTIQLSGGGITVIPDSISFSNNNEMVLLVPHAPFPDNTQMTLTVSGITDDSGNAVSPQTIQFTTGSGPDVTAPVAVSESPFTGATNVPTNAVISLQINEPIDPGTVNSTTLPVTQNNQVIPGMYSVSADGRTITFVPDPPLAANTSSFVYFTGGRGIADLAGNLLMGSANASDFPFTTGSATSVNQPQILATSPASGATSVPTNVQIMVQFNEPVDSATLGQITLSGGSASLSKALSNGNQNLILTPTLPLQASTAYTLNLAGVADLSGNLMAPAVVNFTTGNGATLTIPTITSESPVNGATNVPTSSTIQVTFSKPMDPLTINSGTFYVYPSTTDIRIAGAIAVSADGMTATFTPTMPLDSSTSYVVVVSNGVTDLAGQSGGFQQTSFTTGTGTIAETPVIVTIYPSAQNAVGNTVYVRGSYFGTSQGTSTITFNGVTATPSGWSDTQIAVPVPSGATSGPIVVTVNGVASNGLPFTVTYTPSITNVSATTVSAGTILTITGTNFGSSYDSTTVQFPANLSYALYIPVSSWTETSLTVTVPIQAETGNIHVVVNGTSSPGFALTVVPTPSITLLSPNTGVAGTPVQIVGANFGSPQGSSQIYFDGVPAASVTAWGESSITATPPSNVTTGPVTIVENGITSNADVVFTVTNPSIGSINPPAGAATSTITLSGSGLMAVGLTTQVFFNGVAGSVSQSSTANSLTVTVPSNATSGPVTVTVGTVTSNSVPFTLEQPPTITAVTPNQGPFDPTTGLAAPITITGSGFGPTQSNSTVQFFGSANSANIQSWSDTSITAWVPVDAVSGPIVIAVGDLSAVSPSWFTVDRMAQITDSLGNPTQYSVAVEGGSWFTVASQGSGCSSCTVRGTITNTADANGNTLTTTDELGHTTTYTYDSNNNMASESKQLDSQTAATTSYTYNSFGEVLTSTDALSNTTTNTYDAHGNLLSVTSPAPDSHTPASVTQFAYDTKGELIQITDPLGHITTLTYNSVGLIATITDAQSNVTTYGYDAHGNRTSVIDALHNQTTFAYDTGDRLTTITYPGGSTVGFGYDSRGRRTSVTDQNGKTTTYTYDDADRLTAVTDPAHNSTQYAYDTENNLTSITDANGHVTSFTYDAFGRVTQTAFPSSYAEHYAYDAVGNLISKTDRKGQTIQYVYDALNRLTQKNYPDSTGVDYVYDLVGKIKQVTDPTGVYGFAYDNMGRLIGTTTQYSFLPNQTFTNAYTYDAASNRTGFIAPDGSTNTYSYDTLNRLSGLTNSWSGAFGFSYDALSRRTQLARPNGVNTNYSYDSLSRLLSVLHQTGTTTLDGDSYTYDNAGDRTSKTNYLNGVTEGYTYDPLYELTQVVQGTTTTESYSYDVVGNRLSSLAVPTYTYNSANELVSDSTGSYTYDANGNTLTDASGKQYSWDFENRLTQAVVPGTNGGTTTFKYDPFGRRIQKSGPSGTTNYIYDGANLVEEANAGGGVVALYSQTQNIDEPLAESRSGTTSFYEADGLGSVTSLTAPNGSVAQSYALDSFGNTTNSTGSITNPFRYTAREFDGEIGLYFFRARYIDSSTGRFLSEDPIEFGGGINFYPYALNTPVNLRDPRGKNAIALPIAEGVGGVICFGSGACETAMLVGGAAVAVAGTAALVYELVKHKPCDGNNCAPCIPPVGTIAYRIDVVPPSKPHYPYTGTHWHLYKMNQNPNNCQCFWQDLDQDGQGPTPPGTVPITPAAGGGIQ